MAEFKDVEAALIEQTESGKLKWKVWTDSGGYWVTSCDGVKFTVYLDGRVQVYGDAPYSTLGSSSTLPKVLQESEPIDPDAIRDVALKLALECLQNGKSE